ncbi:hypothetical protein TARUN_1492 [Trichoderma arundinaceum]|uniref:Protein prenyltransferase n=1 Tax=Trichoderma arundinaceum TaxID=490622 RepID=A0A395NXJ9_TRIAR|nr:hypothetical protein TARUN_1492 [Trichoderma arundinaceum]
MTECYCWIPACRSLSDCGKGEAFGCFADGTGDWPLLCQLDKDDVCHNPETLHVGCPAVVRQSCRLHRCTYPALTLKAGKNTTHESNDDSREQMSRALDDDVKRAIKQGDHERIFARIADALSQRLPELLEIEMLGRSHTADGDTILLQDGPAIAVPKLRLVQAFIFARKLLHRPVGAMRNETSRDGDASRATAVMLLMDPEHLTAANTRKRLLQATIKAGVDVEPRLRDELYFVDSLLTSRLHRHTKSPTLWGHRQWLMQRFQDHGLEIDAVSTLKTVISVAAERHPRNYYAWLHARYLANAVSEAGSRGGLSGMLEAAQKWAVSHHDDVSGWAFLMFFLDRHPEYAGPVLSETTRLAASFHWRNESVWYFFRNISSRPWCDRGCREGVESTRLALLRGAEKDPHGKKILEQASSWIQEYSI